MSAKKHTRTIDHNTEEVLFGLLRIGLGLANADDSRDVDFINNRPVDWDGLYRLSVPQSVVAVVYDALKILTDKNLLRENQKPPQGIVAKFYLYALNVEKVWASRKECVRSLAQFYASHNIKMMLLKGHGLSMLYPKPQSRPCGDVDIYLFGDQEKADKLITEHTGIQVDYDNHHHTKFVWNGVLIENHFDFLNTQAHLSNRPIERELKRLALHGNTTAEVDNETFYLPSANFNALFLLRHAAVHFAAEQIILRHLADWALFVKRYHNEIDWPWLEAIAKKQNMHKFLCCLNGVCVSHLGIPKELFPTSPRNVELERCVIDDILYSEYIDIHKYKGSICKSVYIRFVRWWRNRWKHRMVFREGLLFTFIVQVRSHLMKSGELK